MRQFLSLLIAGISLAGVSGCSMLADPIVPESAIPVKQDIALPHYSQADRQCGPAALAMVLAGLGVQITPQELEPLLFTPEREGTLPSDILTGARRSGKLAYPLDGDIESLLLEVAAGNPPITLVNLGLSWLPVYHFLVVTGYDLEAQEVQYTSGRDSRETVSFYTFEAMWDRADRWSAIVVNPETIPATAEPLLFMQAAAALENLDEREAAQKAYRAAHRHWPADYRFPFLLGNTFLMKKDYQRAISWYKRSIHKQKDARVLNNLAWSLYQTGESEKALKAINEAIQVDPAACARECKNTLKKISENA